MTNPILTEINTMCGRRETNRQTSPYIDNNLIAKIINNNNIINNINNFKNKDDFINSCLTTNDNHNIIEYNLKMVIGALNTEINYLRTEISNFNIKVKNLESEVEYLREKMEQMEEKQSPDSRCCVCLANKKLI
jgi:predicted RNase H-like nuclease (RuvC/YqgF family)